MSSTTTSSPAPLKILTSNSSRTVLDGLALAFERAVGQRYTVEFDSAKSMLARIEGGASADVVILGAPVVAGLEKRGTVLTGSCRVFALSRVGVAVRAGAPQPDISSVASLRRALLDARSIAHTVHGASGMYVPALLQRLGIAAQVQTVTRPGGLIARVVAAGEAEIAVQQVSELLAVPEVEVVGLLPSEVQNTLESSMGLFAASSRRDAGAALLRFFADPSNAAAFRQRGLEQGQ